MRSFDSFFIGSIFWLMRKTDTVWELMAGKTG